MNRPKQRWRHHTFLAVCLGQMFCIQILMHSFMHTLIDSFIRYMVVGSTLWLNSDYAFSARIPFKVVPSASGA